MPSMSSKSLNTNKGCYNATGYKLLTYTGTVSALTTNERKTMSHFYAKISESARKTQPTARAHHSLTVEAQSWEGKIVTKLIRATEGDYFQVWRMPHGSSGGDSVLLSEGKMNLNSVSYPDAERANNFFKA